MLAYLPAVVNEFVCSVKTDILVSAIWDQRHMSFILL